MREAGIILTVVGVLLVVVGVLQHFAHVSMVNAPHENVALGVVGVVLAIVGAMLVQQRGRRSAI